MMPPRTAPPALLLLALLAMGAVGCQDDVPGKAELDPFLAEGGHRASFEAFQKYLTRHRLADVVPPEQLLRQGTDWRGLGLPPYAMPPRSKWKNILPTLRLLKQEVIPLFGPLDVLSGFRDPVYNKRAGGARTSRHLAFQALDVRPVKRPPREALRRKLGALWEEKGKQHKLGLGVYCGTRFHVDTGKYRKWGSCPALYVRLRYYIGKIFKWGWAKAQRPKPAAKPPSHPL